jgi:tetratricopeptide (TPR) repeat protein
MSADPRITPWALVLALLLPMGTGGVAGAVTPGAERAPEASRAAPDSARAQLVASVEEALGWVGAAEAALVSGSPLEGTPLAERDLVSDRAHLLHLLDTLSQAGTWAGPELARLRSLHPDAVILLRAHALWHLAEEELEGAAPLLSDLLELRPRDTEIHRGWSRVLLHRGDLPEARSAMARAFELEPWREDLFRSLLVLHEEADALSALAGRLARLRRLHPDLSVLAEREREVAHRLARARGPGGAGG